MAKETPGSNYDDRDEAPAYLDTDPPHLAARGLAYILIFFFVTAAVASFIITVPETVQADFVLVPTGGADPVRAPRAGVVAQVMVSEGQAVAQGDTLFVIKSELAGERAADVQLLDAQLRGSQESVSLAMQLYRDKQLANREEETKLRARLDYLGQAIGFKKKEIALAEGLAARYEKLQKDGLVSAVDYTRNQVEINRLSTEMEGLNNEQRQAQLAIEKLRHEAAAMESEYKERERGLNETLQKTVIRMDALKNDLFRAQGNEVTILAPQAGTIIALQVKGAAALVKEGDVLCEMTLAKDRVQAEMQIPEWGVGRIKAGQKVRLMYDAFPYQRYGVRYGTIRWISPAKTKAQESQSFRALVDASDESVTVEGEPRRLLPGMSGKAEVVVGRRSLISYAFEPIRRLKENISESPDQ